MQRSKTIAMPGGSLPDAALGLQLPGASKIQFTFKRTRVTGCFFFRGRCYGVRATTLAGAIAAMRQRYVWEGLTGCYGKPQLLLGA